MFAALDGLGGQFPFQVSKNVPALHKPQDALRAAAPGCSGVQRFLRTHFSREIGKLPESGQQSGLRPLGECQGSLAGEKKKLFLSGELIATFKDQKSFDSFLEFCRNNYFVGAFDMNKKLWKFKKYFYLAPTEGNLKVCATNRLDGITFDGIVNGKVFKK